MYDEDFIFIKNGKSYSDVSYYANVYRADWEKIEYMTPVEIMINILTSEQYVIYIDSEIVAEKIDKIFYMLQLPPYKTDEKIVYRLSKAYKSPRYLVPEQFVWYENKTSIENLDKIILNFSDIQKIIIENGCE